MTRQGWDSWMASPTQWTGVCVSSGSWWWTGKPGVLLSVGLQRVRHDWATELIYLVLRVSLLSGTARSLWLILCLEQYWETNQKQSRNKLIITEWINPPWLSTWHSCLLSPTALRIFSCLWEFGESFFST